MGRVSKRLTGKRESARKGHITRKRKLVDPNGSSGPSTSAKELCLDDISDRIPPKSHNESGLSESIAQSLVGRRVLSCDSICSALKLVSVHGRACPLLDICFQKEVAHGLQSKIHFVCKCGWEVIIQSDSGKEQHSINIGLGWGCANTPLGHDDLSTFLTCIDVPSPSKFMYKKYQDEVALDIITAAENSMKEAGEEEFRLAVEAGDFVNVGGITLPNVLVYLDAGWAVRSYSHSYTSNYGHAGIVGVRTNKILFSGVRQKVCLVCTKAKRIGRDPRPHECSKNWNKASTAMEANIILEGFSNSIGMHKLVYSKFIGDGDSSVHATVKDVYDGIEVQKIECINHVIRNVNRNLTLISANAKKNRWEIPQDERKIPGMATRFNQVGKLLNIITKYYHDRGNFDVAWPQLSAEISNIVRHIFGCHTDCKDFYCDTVGSLEDGFEFMSNLQTYIAVREILERPSQLARSLIERKTSNPVESFMGTVAKFLEGKRKNLGGMTLHKQRVFAAVLSYNTSPFFSASAYRFLTSNSPNILWKNRNNESDKRRHQIRTRNYKPRTLTYRFLKSKGDFAYGSNPKRPDLPVHELQLSISRLYSELQVSGDRQLEIELVTRKQSDSEEWKLHRRNRITASNAGRICKLRDTTDIQSIIKTLLGFTKLRGEALQYGKEKEKDAIAKYEEVKGLSPGSVLSPGLFVSVKNGIFGASPDGLVGNDGLLEVKCPHSMRDSDPVNLTNVKTSAIVSKNGIISLKKNHDHFYQIAMQLVVTGRQWCDYFVWSRIGHICIRILRSDVEDIWHRMEAKLEKFWLNDLAPEIVDSRLSRGFKKCRIPQYRLDAIASKTSNTPNV